MCHRTPGTTRQPPEITRPQELSPLAALAPSLKCNSSASQTCGKNRVRDRGTWQTLHVKEEPHTRKDVQQRDKTNKTMGGAGQHDSQGRAGQSHGETPLHASFHTGKGTPRGRACEGRTWDPHAGHGQVTWHGYLGRRGQCLTKCTFAAKPSNSTFVVSLREMETHVHTQAYERTSSAGLFIRQNWKRAQDPSTETETRGASPHRMESEGMETAPTTLGFPVCNLPIMQLLAAAKSAVGTNISGTRQSC